MEVCFCGQNHKNMNLVKEFFYKNKCSVCRYEREKELWEWLNENGLNFNHYGKFFHLTTSDGKYLPIDFCGNGIFLELDEKGCDHIPYTSDFNKYNESKDFHSYQSETRYKIRRMFNDPDDYLIRFPLELCSREHFHKIRKAMDIIENYKTNGYRKVIVLIKNGEDDNRYDYLDNYINDISRNELHRLKFEIIH